MSINSRRLLFYLLVSISISAIRLFVVLVARLTLTSQSQTIVVSRKCPIGFCRLSFRLPRPPAIASNATVHQTERGAAHDECPAMSNGPRSRPRTRSEQSIKRIDASISPASFSPHIASLLLFPFYRACLWPLFIVSISLIVDAARRSPCVSD